MPADLVKVKELFLAVLEIPAHERAAYLDTACAGDTALRQQIEAMLQSHQHSGELLPRSPAAMLADSGATDADATSAFAPQPDPSATPSEQAPGEPNDLSFLAPSAKPEHLGRLGHYEVKEVIGKGGFGIVLRAFDERLHRVVAIKVLAPAYAANGSARKRFIREARAAAAVKNEHVVGIYDVQENAQPPYLVMECIDGIALQDKIDQKGTLGVKEVLRIGMQMAEGLAAAHKQGIVHRDIKPANILLENGVERVKITDFGLARAVDDASVTQSGTVAGTPMYMSPEQAEGLPVDHRSDLFSLGTVLYAMCTGHPPFRASGTHAVLKRVIEASPRPMREINNEVPGWLCDIISKLHAKKSEDRFQTAREVAELLGQHLAHVQQPMLSPRPAAVAVPASAPTTAIPTELYRVSAIVGMLLFFSIVIFGICFLVGFTFSLPDPMWTVLAPLGSGLYAISAVVVAWRYRRIRATRPWTPLSDPLAVALGSLAVLLPVFIYLAPEPRGTVGLLQVTEIGQPVDYAIHDQNDVPIFDTRWIVPPTDQSLGMDGFSVRCDRRFHDYRKYGNKAIIRLPVGRYTLLAIKDSKSYERTSFVVAMNAPVSLALPVPPTSASSDPGWVQLFNGKDLTGWSQPHGAGTWKIVNGILTGTAEQGEDGGLPSLRNDYADFHLRAEVRLKGPGHSGIFFRNHEGYHLLIDQKITGSLALAHPWKFLDLKKDVPVNTESWFTLELIADGPNLTSKVNGQIVADIVDRTKASGLFELELFPENGPVVVEFKKIEIKELPPTFKDDKERLQGHWVAESVEMDGAPRPQEIVARMSLTFSGNRVKAGPVVAPLTGESTFYLDEQANPKKIDIIDENRKGTFGIYRFDGDRFVLCGGDDDEKDRPTEFSSKEGKNRMVAVFKRATAEDPGWVQLFNGKDLTGWTTFPKGPGGWKVVDGHLVCDGPTSYLFTERQDYKDFHFRVEARLGAKANSGQYFRCQFGPGHPKGYWAQMQNSDPGSPHRTGTLARNPPDNTLVSIKEELVPDNTWFTQEVIARGNHIQILVNGKKVVDFIDKDETYLRGRLALEHYPPQTRVEFKKVEIKELPPEEPGWGQLFNGKDLTGWKVVGTPKNSWQIRDGMIWGGGAQTYLVSERKFTNFHLKAEVRVSPGCEGRILCRADPTIQAILARTFVPLAVKFKQHPLSRGISTLEVQLCLQWEPVGRFYTHLRTFKADQWLGLDLIANGDRVTATFVVAGVPEDLSTQVDPARQLGPGPIMLYLGTKEGSLEYRKIEIKELPSRPLFGQ
jgi:uncharacterized protein (TIGR03067 family)